MSYRGRAVFRAIDHSHYRMASYSTQPDLTDFDNLLNYDGVDHTPQLPFNDLSSCNLPTSTAPIEHGFAPSDFHNPQPPDAPHPDPLTLDDYSSAPQITKPPVPCDYCAARGLECFFIDRNETGCSSCRALFHRCTFVSHKPKNGWLHTLDTVTEDKVCDIGQMVRTVPMFSHGASMNDILDSYVKSRPERTSTRFPRSTSLVLKRWLEAHAENPYPTDDQKLALKDDTGLSLNQITTWLANARRRGKARGKQASSPIPISIAKSTEQADMNPFGESYQHVWRFILT